MARRRVVGSAQQPENAAPPPISTDDTRGSTPLVIRTLKIVSVAVVVLYVLIPSILCLPPIAEQILYMNLYIGKNEVETLSQPASEYQLKGTAAFHIDCGGVKLGVWHVLPKELIGAYKDDDHSQDGAQNMLKDAKNVIVYHHGAGTTRATGDNKQRAEIYKLFQWYGYHTIAYDYRGFGDSTGWPSEPGLVNDSLCIHSWLKGKVAPDTKVIFWGHSLGASVATLAAKRIFDKCPSHVDHCAHIDGLILEGGFVNVRKGAEDNAVVQMALNVYPKMILMKGVDIGLGQTTLSTDTNLPMVRCPVMLMYAEDDDVIPCKNGEELFSICKDKMKHKNKRVVFVKFKASYGYGHMDIYKAPELPKIIKDFVEGKNGAEEFKTISF